MTRVEDMVRKPARGAEDLAVSGVGLVTLAGGQRPASDCGACSDLNAQAIAARSV
ncbi:hypothetical protein KCP71_16165 [Salmonella enterica subsp. enterica]|nr:hypothetical protein KCP71_16165 [Salmonella enterica subsp. enterica]